MLNKLSEEKSIENNIRRTNETIFWINSREKILRSQDLKNQEVLFKHKDKIAKGDIKIKTFIIIYLKEYDRTRLKSDNVSVPLIRPSIVKILIEEEEMEILVFIVFINSEKQIFLLNKFSPKFLIAKEILEFKSNNKSNKKNEKFIKIPNIINFIIKLDGFSIPYKS